MMMRGSRSGAGRAALITLMFCRDTLSSPAAPAAVRNSFPAWISSPHTLPIHHDYQHHCRRLASSSSVSQRRPFPSVPLPVLLTRGIRAGAAGSSSSRWMASSSAMEPPQGVPTKQMTIDKMLQSQGHGTRKVCKKLAQEGLLTICGEEVRKADVKIEVWEGMPYTVEDEEWEYMEKVYVMLHKPAGYECTNKAKVHPIVFDLLPLQLQERGVQCVGRLDQDTTGLLLLTDDGDLNHVLTSPKKSKKKVYVVDCKHEVSDEVPDRLMNGVRLVDEPDQKVAAYKAAKLSETSMEITITEGKYHQVKRMIAAVGNRVEALHRRRVCALEMPGDLEPGEWCWLSRETVQAKLLDSDS